LETDSNANTRRAYARAVVDFLANHASTRTAQLYDRRSDQVSLDEIERVRI